MEPIGYEELGVLTQCGHEGLRALQEIQAAGARSKVGKKAERVGMDLWGHVTDDVLDGERAQWRRMKIRCLKSYQERERWIIFGARSRDMTGEFRPPAPGEAKGWDRHLHRSKRGYEHAASMLMALEEVIRRRVDNRVESLPVLMAEIALVTA